MTVPGGQQRTMCTAEAVDPTATIPLCDEHLAVATSEEYDEGQQPESHTTPRVEFAARSLLETLGTPLIDRVVTVE